MASRFFTSGGGLRLARPIRRVRPPRPERSAKAWRRDRGVVSLCLAALAWFGGALARGEDAAPPPAQYPTVVWVAPHERPPAPSLPLATFQGRGQPELNAPAELRPIEGAASLTLGDLEQIAMDSNPTLVQAAMKVQAAQGRCIQAGLYPNPVIGYRGDEIGDGGSEGLQGGFVAQRIVTGGKLRLGQAVAGHEIDQARYQWEAQRRRILNDVRAGYFQVLVAQKMIDVNGQLLRLGEEGVQVTEQLQAALEISRAEVLQARIEVEQARLRLVRAKQSHQAAWRRLAALLGRPDMAPVPLIGDASAELPVLHWEEARAQLLTQSPELDAARAGVERARCRVAQQCAQRIPNIEIEGAAKYNTASRFTVADVTLAVPIPLCNRNQGNIRSAWAELSAAQSELRRMELDLSNRFAASFGDYAVALESVKAYTETILPNAKTSLDLVSTGYREGEFGYLALLTAQRTYFQVNLQYLASLQQLRDRAVEIEGLMLTGGLQPAS